MVIQHNLASMNANRMLGVANSTISKSSEKLSSGYRINRAADDAAGLSISEKMRKQIRGLDRASTNVEDGISLTQVADGALTETHSMLQRMNELCVQAANGTNSESDRQAIQQEINQLKLEINRVATTTSFNNAVYPLNGPVSEELSVRELPSAIQICDVTVTNDLNYPVSYNGTIYNSGDEITFKNVVSSNFYTSSSIGATISTCTLTDSSPSPTRASIYRAGDVTTNSLDTFLGSIDLAYDPYTVLTGFRCLYIDVVTEDDIEEDGDGDLYFREFPEVEGAYSDYEYFTSRGRIIPNTSLITVGTDYKPFTSSEKASLESSGFSFLKYSESTKTLTDLSDNPETLYIQSSAESNSGTEIKMCNATSKGLNIDGVSVTSQYKAVNSITTVANAISVVSKMRSRWGAYQNSLEHCVANLDNTVENTTAAESRIRDTDMAKEMTTFSADSIIQQAGQAMLSQANTSLESVLQLLQ